MIPVSRKRLITTTIGVILAVAIIFTSYTLGNNMAKYQFYNQLKGNPYQISVSVEGNMGSIVSSYNEIRDLEHVKNVVLISQFPSSLGWQANYTPIPVNYGLGLNITVLEGNLSLSQGEVMVSETAAEANNWTVGDTISLLFYNQSGYPFLVNYTVSAVGVWNLPNTSYYSYPYALGDVLIGLSDAENLSLSGVECTSSILVALDENYLLKSTDYNDAMHKINAVETRVYHILESNGVYYIPQEQYYDYGGSIVFLLFTIFFSLPVIVMGVYLSRVGIEIEFLERRREFGILKIRGVTGGALTKFILFEATIYSLVGGLLGYALGESLAYLSNKFFLRLPFFFFDFGLWEVVGAVVISSFLFFIAMSSPWSKIKKEPILNLISHYSQSFKEVGYKQRNRDIVLSAILWLYVGSALWLLKNVNFTGGFNLLVIIAFIILGTIGFMFPLILILLPLTMSRLLTMGTTKVYRVVASSIAKIFKTSGELAERSIERGPRRAAYLAFILAFILTLSTFLAITMDNTKTMSEIQREMGVGADVAVDLTDQNIPWNILNGSNVSRYVVVYRLDYSVWQVDMKEYIATIYHGDMFIKEGKIEGKGVVLTANEAQSRNVGVGDYITLVINGTSRLYYVEAIMYSFPGITYANIIVDSPNPGEIPDEVIIRASNLKALETELEENGYPYSTAGEESDMEVMMFQFINTLLLYLVILGASAIFIVQYSSLLNRRGEIALYKVRGARNNQISAMLMTEGLTVIVISFIIGTLIGMALAYMMSTLMNMSSYMPEIFVLGSTFLLYTGVLILAYILSQLALSYIFSRTKPSEVIRGLGGEI